MPDGGWHSFSRLLGWACDLLRPKRIVEWGPGFSTEVMAKACPAAIIHSFEHDPVWCDRARERLRGYENVHLHYRRISLVPGESTGYVTAALREGGPASFDLAFVDGRMRCDCLTFAWLLLKPTGFAVLHDAERPAYRPAIDLYPLQMTDPCPPVTVGLWKDPSVGVLEMPDWATVTARHKGDG